MKLTCNILIQKSTETGNALRESRMTNSNIFLSTDERGNDVLVLEKGKKSNAISLSGNVVVHRTFELEGKASITIKKLHTLIMINNCASNELEQFLDAVIDCKSSTHNSRSNQNSQRRKLTEVTNITPVRGNPKRSRLTEKQQKEQQERRLQKSHNQQQQSKQGQENKPPNPQRTPSFTYEPKGPSKNSKKTRKITPSKIDLLRGSNHLSVGQKEVVKSVLTGKSTFFTGGAGTGKSFLLKTLVKDYVKKDGLFVTATTGVSAYTINGTTINSFAGFSGGEDEKVRLKRARKKESNWVNCKVLVIDEVSMLDGDYFDDLESTARIMKKNSLPFGGIQLILCGDFLQLPPVSTSETKKKFCFEAKGWEKCLQKTLELKTVFRQKDNTLINVLKKIRVGVCDDFVKESLQSTKYNTVEQDGIHATELCTHVEKANRANLDKLKMLSGEGREYSATYEFSSESSDFTKNHTREQLKRMSHAGDQLHFKRGTQVMLLKNIDVKAGLVNGARGVIVGFQQEKWDKEPYPVVKFMSGLEKIIKKESWELKTRGRVLGSRKQIPLSLAWAISIHKSQGLTLDFVKMDITQVFEAGQAYVALSRARTLESICVTRFDASKIQANKTALQFYLNLRKERSQQLL